MGLFSSIGKVVGGVVNGVTGLLGVKGQKDANSQANALAREQLEYQKELHKNQIQWKVEDAKKAGLHPLAGLGVSPSSFSPVSGASYGVNYSGLNGIGDTLSDMGQDIDRSILQAKTKEEQKDALRLQNQSIALDLRGKDLNNQILEAELASRRARLAQMMGPPTPASSGLSAARYAIPGQTQSRFMDAPIKKYSWQITPDGKYEFGPSSDYAGLYEDKLGIEWLPFLESAVLPKFKALTGQPLGGRKWSFSDWDWIPIKNKTSYERFIDQVRGKPSKKDNAFHRFARWFERRWPSSGY